MDITTFRSGILQARAYRNLRTFMVKYLADKGMTMVEWSILGLIHEGTPGGGVRAGYLAQELDVEPSFITAVITKLNKLSYIKTNKDQEDGRVKVLTTTPAGDKRVAEVEEDLRLGLAAWLKDISLEDLNAYVKVLKLIAYKEME